MTNVALETVKLFNIGNSVAEFDEHLDNYFVETETFRQVVENAGDIIAGDKGTGKTAIYRVLKRSYRTYKSLDSVEMVDAFNIQGNPIFQRLLTGPSLSEGQYRTFWKAYVFALVGNYLIDIYGDHYSNEMTELKNTLDYLGISAKDVTPANIFGKLHNLLKSFSNPSAVEAGFTFSETGMPVVTPRIEFGPEIKAGTEIFADDFLATLDRAAGTTDLSFWVLFDRLDEAFTGSPEIEIPALRALMRTYLDLAGMSNVRLKLFVRKDLFRRIIQGGFVNLTHINARRIDIIWEEEDLINMIVRRMMLADEFTKVTQLEGKSNTEIMNTLLPEQIDSGSRKPATQVWIMSRIRDGNDAKPPRNLIDLLNKAKERQISKDTREPRVLNPGAGPIIEASSMKRAFSQLSELRVQDTLLAEASDLVEAIERFRDGKAEHNSATLINLLGETGFKETIQSLLDAGFLEKTGENYKVPALYREGLNITQGKAF